MRLRAALASCLAIALYAPIHLYPHDLRPSTEVRVGVERTDELLRLTEGKRIAVVANKASIAGADRRHVVDRLVAAGVDVRRVFAPEHGFREWSEAGEVVQDGRDIRTGIEVVSLYGNRKKPTQTDLADVDAVLFDIQDVGTRFYTYISTMHYVMEACAEAGKTFIVADRPNPNDTVDGTILRPGFESFVGMHPIPLLHGLTVGELAGMINGEGWLAGGKPCKLEVIHIEGWRHGDPYEVASPPSPNLPNGRAIQLYPSLCLFEGTGVSVGRGTAFPFQVAGYPNKAYGTFHFRPEASPGFDSNPLHKGKDCYGIDLRQGLEIKGLSLRWLTYFYKIATQAHDPFFTRPDWFDLLAGSDELRHQLQQGCTEAEIRASWEAELRAYKALRAKYLLYPTF